MVKSHTMTKKITYFILFFIAVLIFLCSCSSTKKIKTNKSLKADISTKATNDSARVKKVDSTGTTITEKTSISSAEVNNVKTTTDSSSETITVNLADDTAKGGTKANDYEGAPKVYDVTINGNKIHSNRPINNIVIQNKKGSQVIDASAIKTKDSSLQRNNTVVNVNKTDSGTVKQSNENNTVIETKESNVQVKKFGISLNFLLLLLFAGVGLVVAWRTGAISWLLAFFKKKRSDKNQT